VSKHKKPVKGDDDVVRTPADDQPDNLAEPTLGETMADNLPINVVKQDDPPKPVAADPNTELTDAEKRERDVRGMATQFQAPESLATYLLERNYGVEGAYRVFDAFGRSAIPGVQGPHWVSPEGTAFGDIKTAPKAGGVEVGPDGNPVSQPLKEGETTPKPVEDKATREGEPGATR